MGTHLLNHLLDGLLALKRQTVGPSTQMTWGILGAEECDTAHSPPTGR